MYDDPVLKRPEKKVEESAEKTVNNFLKTRIKEKFSK